MERQFEVIGDVVEVENPITHDPVLPGKPTMTNPEDTISEKDITPHNISSEDDVARDKEFSDSSI